MTKKRHTVAYTANAVVLDDVTYSLEGCTPAVFWRLALEGLVARLKRSTDRDGAYKVLMEGRYERQTKTDDWIVAYSAAMGIPLDQAKTEWASFSREKRSAIRRHPAVYAEYASEAGPLSQLVEKR
jgi:hypothetical protein